MMLNDQWWTKTAKQRKETFRIVPSTWEQQWVHSTAERLLGSPSAQYCPVVWTWIWSLELSACNSACVEACVPTNLLASLLRFNLGSLAGTGAGAVISSLTSLLLEWSLVSSVALYPCSEIRVRLFWRRIQQGWERNLPNKSLAWKELHLSALAVLFPLSQSLF